MTETHLYRCFDSRGCLLYVGISVAAFKRIKQHESKASWFRNVDKITIKTFTTREEALEAEATAIRDEEPLFNIAIAARPLFDITPATQPDPEPRLTDKTVLNAPAPTSGSAFIRDDKVIGFALCITKTGFKSFVVEGRVNGRNRRSVIGPAYLFTVPEARDKARQLLAGMKMGIDPRKERRAQRISAARYAVHKLQSEIAAAIRELHHDKGHDTSRLHEAFGRIK
jgi:hypothetical protein